jgi:hypothetical protein
VFAKRGAVPQMAMGDEKEKNLLEIYQAHERGRQALRDARYSTTSVEPVFRLCIIPAA